MIGKNDVFKRVIHVMIGEYLTIDGEYLKHPYGFEMGDLSYYHVYNLVIL